MAPMPAPAPGGATPGRFPLAPVILVAVGLLMALVAVIVTLNDDGGGDTTETAAGGEVFLEAAADPGPEVFTDPVDPAPPASTTLPDAPAGAVPASGTAPPPGSPPYGGSGDDRVCDREQLISFLTSQPDRAAAWAGVVGVAVEDIPATVRSLTPTVLLYDTRVTNHGFSGGRATPRQSVLQAGTAVLVDGEGDPVVRCRCGNPLAAPRPLTRPAVVGTPWPDFDPEVLVAVEAGVTVTVTIEVTVTAPPGSDATQPASTEPPSTEPPTSETIPPATEPVTQPPVTADPDLDDLDREAAAGLLAAISECTTEPVTLVDVEPLEGFTGGFTITLDIGGTTMLFVYEPATGTITEGDRASADLIASCGIA